MKCMAIAVLLAMAVGAPVGLVRADDVTAAGAAAQPISLHGRVDGVTVYRGQALVTRVVDLPGGPGLGEFVVTDLPERVIGGSLFAESSEGVEVRSIRYLERPVAEDVRAEVQKLDSDIRKLQDAMASTQRNIALQGEQKDYLDKLEQFAAPTANLELTKGVLNADTLKTLTQFIFSQRQTIADTELKLQQTLRDEQDVLNLTQRQRDEVTGNSSHTAREAVIFVNRKNAGGKINVRYLVDGATWDPSYNIRADAGRQGATVEYNAAIEQMSGEEWPDVAMTLSTATPSLVANAPVLAPLSIALQARAAQGGGGGGAYDYNAAKSELAQARVNAEMTRSLSGANGFTGNTSITAGTLSVNANSAGGIQNTGAPSQQGQQTTVVINGKTTNYNDVELNKVADQLQVLELVAKEQKPEEDAQKLALQAQEGIVVTYQLGARTSLPSRSDRQLIQIASLPMKGEFYKVAIPVLTNYVYDQAAMTNTSKMVLLAGPVASYMAGQYMGSGDIPTVAVGQPFSVGFGIDPSLRATRERVDKTDTIQGGNRLVNYTYRLAVENFGDTPADVRLMDRGPTATDAEVKITFDGALLDPSKEKVELSKDKEYQMTDLKNNIWRWDIQVPAQKTGTEAFALEYQLHMEYDKNLGISNAPILKLQEMNQR